MGVALPDWLDADTWSEYVKMRKLIRKPMTERAMTIAINKLTQLRQAGNDPTEVLEQSIFESWQGLYEVHGPTVRRMTREDAVRREINVGASQPAQFVVFTCPVCGQTYRSKERHARECAARRVG